MECDVNLDSLYEELAGRFRALSQFFGHLGTKDSTERLFESLMSGDPKVFARLIEPLDVPGIPPLGKCVWLQEILERAVVSPESRRVCRLRSDLRGGEWRLLATITSRHPVLASWLTGSEIPPGPFLAELEANGLVNCKDEPTKKVSFVPVLGRPENICL